jgi:hypothetical protein
VFEDVVREEPRPFLERWFAPGEPYLIARWIWLRALGAIFLSAFYSLYFQIHGLMGPNGLLPASEFLTMVHSYLGAKSYRVVPTLLWLNASDRALDVLVWSGLIASVALILNIWPRVAIGIAGVAFLSFVAAAQDFSGYQSDSMLLEAALLSVFLAPRGIRPGFGTGQPPSRVSVFMLQWEWFRIYLESGMVKIMSGEPQWRNLTAMDKYYENGPLPTWIGWYVQQWPHGFHAFTAGATLVAELLIAWLVLFPQPAKRICFLLTTPLQIGIILTANYAFLNYLVLFLGVLMLDDKVFRGAPALLPAMRSSYVQVVVLPILFVTTIAAFMFPAFPTVQLLAPFRVTNNYGLFAVMTRARYEIEFQGTRDGTTWIAYPFRYKPQDPMKAPGIYAPYQPRFEWNLWFASLDVVENNRFVLNTQARLLTNEPSVLRLFASNPFGAEPPVAVRAVQWRYWFTTSAERRATGAWWKREYVGLYSNELSRAPLPRP